jgi:preprotein translocase subunit YajC
VSLLLTESFASMQPEATSGAQEHAPSGGPPGPGGGGGLLGNAGTFVPLLLMFAIFYFLLLRPQQKRQREVDAMLKALHKGDKVRTSGGIRGEILDLTDTEVTLLIADKVKVNVLRSHIAARINTPEATKEKT